MFLFPFKFLFYFVLSFFILSFPIQDKPLFSYLNKLAAPYATPIYNSVIGVAETAFNKGKKVSKTLFSNATPKITDTIQEKISSTHKTRRPIEKEAQIRAEEEQTILEGRYTEQEKELLKSILESAQ